MYVVTGCTGEISDVGGPSGDNGTDAGLTADAPAVQPLDAPGSSFACRERVTTNLRDGEHNPGQDCNGACHDHGFTLGGTLYASATGGAPVTGATITVIDATNRQIDVVTAQNGNFFTSQVMVFPVKVIASACPDVRPMVTQVTAADAGCNRSGCHATGAATGPIHLP